MHAVLPLRGCHREQRCAPQDTSEARLSRDQVQRILAVDSQAAVKALLRECPEIAELEPLLIRSRLYRLKVRASLLYPGSLACTI